MILVFQTEYAPHVGGMNALQWLDPQLCQDKNICGGEFFFLQS